MLFEHLIYSTIIAIIAGMIQLKRKGRDYSWIIILSAFAPDLDIFAGHIFKLFDIAFFLNGFPLKHGDFHNIMALILYAGVVGLLLRSIGLVFKDSFILAGTGFFAHIMEDILVYNPGYAFLWPLSSHVFGIGIIEYIPDWYGFANTDVLIAGIIGLILAGMIRLIYEGNSGLKNLARTFIVVNVFLLIIIPAIGLYDGNFKEEVASTVVDNWHFTQNASWDTAYSHSGSHSAKIHISGNESRISGIWRSSNIRVLPDTNYTLSSWGKTEGIGGINLPAIRIVELDAKGNWIEQTNLIFDKAAQNWTKKEIAIKTNSNTIQVYVYGNIWKGYGTFRFDDIELYKEGTDNNMILNGGFENGAHHIIYLDI